MNNENGTIIKGNIEPAGFLKSDFEDRYKVLPDSIRRALASWQTGSNIQTILAGRNIKEDRLADVLHLAGLVLLGFYSREDFVEYLAEDLKVDSLAGQAIAKEIDAKIFLPLKNDIKNLYQMPLASEKSDLKYMGGIVENKLNLDWKAEESEAGIENKPRIDNVDLLKKSLPTNPVLAENKQELIADEAGNNAGLKKSEAVSQKIFPREMESMVKEEPLNNKPPALIFGKEKEIRPTLESKPAITNVFDEVKPKEKPIVIDFEANKNEQDLLKKNSLFGKLKGVLGIKNIDNDLSLKKLEPAKIVDYSAEGGNKNGEKKFEDKENAGIISSKPLKNESRENKADNVIDLKKMKF